ncbi:MAG: Ig-like domain-containing protein [Candidatus Faecivicinus sp.]
MMKRWKLLVLLAGTMIFFACIFGAQCEENAPEWFFYGEGGQADGIEADFGAGVQLHLTGLKGFDSVGVRIGDESIKKLTRNPEEDCTDYDCAPRLAELAGETQTNVKVVGYRESMPLVLWEGILKNIGSGTEPRRLQFCFLQMDAGAVQEGSACISGAARCGNRLEVYIDGVPVNAAVADEENRFAVELDGGLSRGAEVVVSMYSETGEGEAFLQSAQFACEGGGVLELKELDDPTPEPKADSFLDGETPLVRVCTADGREVRLVPGDESVQTLYVSGDVLTVSGALESHGEAEHGEWTLRVQDSSGVIRAEAQEKGSFEEQIQLDKVETEEGVQFWMIVDCTHQDRTRSVSLAIVRDNTCAYLATSDHPDAALPQNAVIPENCALLVCCDEGEIPAATVNGSAVPLTAWQGQDGETGRFELPLEGFSGALQISVDDGHGNVLTAALTLDEAPVISLDGAAAAPGGMISGQTEAGAEVALLVDGETVAAAVADESDCFSLSVPDELSEDALMELVATDDAGNVTRVPVGMEQAQRTPVAVDEGEIVLDADGKAALSGAGEPGKTLYYSADGGAEEALTDVGEDGCWSAVLPAEAFDDSIQEHTLLLYYADDPEGAVSLTVMADRECALTVDACQEGDTCVKGSADPGANVELIIADEGYVTAADAAGSYVFELERPLKWKETLRLSAQDAHGNTAAPVEQTVVASPGVAIVLKVQQSAGALRFTGSAKPGRTVEIWLNEAVVGTAEAAQDGSFAIRAEEVPLNEGENAFQARYAEEMDPEFASKVVVLTIDTQPPELTLDQTAVTSASAALSGSVSEPSTVLLMANGAILAQADSDASGAFFLQMDPQPVGEQLTVYAVDVYGNRSGESIQLTVAPALERLGCIESPVPGSEQSCFGTMKVSGYVLHSGELTGLALKIGEKVIPLAQLSAETASDEDRARFAAQILPETLTRFETEVDAAGLPLGEAELTLCLNDGTQIPLAEKVEIRIAKLGGYLPQRVFLLAVLLVGAMVAVAAFVYTGKQLRLMKDSVDEADEGRVRTTLKNRAND